MIRIVFAGYFDLWPDIKIIIHHMGAMILYNEGRVGSGYDVLGVRSPGEDYGNLLKTLKKRPLDYFKMFYADTALFGALTATNAGWSFSAQRMFFTARIARSLQPRDPAISEIPYGCWMPCLSASRSDN